MLVYRYDEKTKEFLGEFKAQLDPLESKKANKEIWLLPADSTFNKPLSEKEGFKIKWNGDSWVYEEIPIEPEPEPYIPTIEEKSESVRQVRNQMIDAFEWRISRNNDERELGLTETDNRELLLKYRVYLRDYPEQENWWESNPLTFEEWKQPEAEEPVEQVEPIEQEEENTNE